MDTTADYTVQGVANRGQQLLPVRLDEVDESVGGRVVVGHGVSARQFWLDDFGQRFAELDTEI